MMRQQKYEKVTTSTLRAQRAPVFFDPAVVMSWFCVPRGDMELPRDSPGFVVCGVEAASFGISDHEHRMLARYWPTLRALWGIVWPWLAVFPQCGGVAKPIEDTSGFHLEIAPVRSALRRRKLFPSGG